MASITRPRLFLLTLGGGAAALLFARQRRRRAARTKTTGRRPAIRTYFDADTDGDDAPDDSSAVVKRIWFVRHGEGWHNVAFSRGEVSVRVEASETSCAISRTPRLKIVSRRRDLFREEGETIAACLSSPLPSFAIFHEPALFSPPFLKKMYGDQPPRFRR